MWTVEDRERYKDDGRRYPSDLTDAEWELVRSLFETDPTLTRDIRAMVDGCLYLGAEGCRWRSLPKDFGPWQTVRGYWDRFRRDGVWADVAALLIPVARARLGAGPAPADGGARRRAPAAACADGACAAPRGGAEEGGARGGRDQEGEGHQAPPPDL